MHNDYQQALSSSVTINLCYSISIIL